MEDCSDAIDDDNLAKLMPNTAKLIGLGEANSLESKGSTSMSLSGNSVTDGNERQIRKPSRKRQGESLFRDIANKFLRTGENGKRSVIASKSSALATLSSNHRVRGPSAEGWRNSNAYVLDKENVRPKVPITTLVKQGSRSKLQQNMATGDESQKFAGKVRKLPSHSQASSYFSVTSKIQRADKSDAVTVSENLTQPAATVTLPKAPHSSQGSKDFSNVAGKKERGKAKLYMTTMPLNLSELKEKFAEIDGEALEEEEVSIALRVARLTRTRPVLASVTSLHLADGILQNGVENRMDLPRSKREEVENVTSNLMIEKAVRRIHSPRHGQEGVGIGQSKASKTASLDQDAQVSEPTGEGKDTVLSSGHDRNAINCPARQLSPSEHLDWDDGNLERKVKCRIEGNPPCIAEDSASPSVKGLNEQARTADMTTSHQIEAIAPEISGKGTSVCADFELENAEPGCSPTTPTMDNLKETTADRPDAYPENSVPPQASPIGNEQSSSSRETDPLEQDNVPDIPLQRGSYSARETSAGPLRLHYRRRGRSIGMNQRRLAFESASDSKQKAMDKSSDDSVSTVEFRGRTKSAVGDINHIGHDFDENCDDNMPSVPDQDPKTILLADDNVIDQLNGRDCISLYSKPKAATPIEGVVDREKLGSLAPDGNLPAFEGSVEMGKDPYGLKPLNPQAGPATGCLKIRGKRTWANLGPPIDGGSEWKEGRRVSTRIKSRPLDWWRGERMLYGRVHSTLCTLIGIKTTSPDPVWPRPKPRRGDYTMRNFQVDSFVDDTYDELLRLAAQ